MNTFLAVLLTLAVLCGFVGILVGGKVGQVLIITGTVFAGVDLLVKLIGAS